MKYLSIDWGLKKVGLAVSEGEFSSPLQTININGLRDGVKKVAQIIRREKAEIIVMGQPEGEMGKNVARVEAEFKKEGISVRLVDETLTTHEAKNSLLEMGAGQKDRRDDNKIAAAIILQNFLDDQR